jgi:eukaryotic-like serine/threonine-protein kinase
VRPLIDRLRGTLGLLPPLEPLEALEADERIGAALDRAQLNFAERVVALREKAGELGLPANPHIKSIGGFTVLRELGRGGMGAVYLARHEGEEPIVIKVPFSEFGAASQYTEIFFREFAALSTVRHPNIVRVFRYGKDETHNVFYYVAEFVDGVTLKDYLESLPEQRFCVSEAAVVMLAVVRALRFLRERQVSHRDLKPGNVMFNQQGEVKLIDFGAAKIGGQSSELTHSGVVMGTFDYLAPEAGLRGERKKDGEVAENGPERDLFAVGVMFYRLLKGRLPHDFGGGADASIAFARFAESWRRPLQDLSGLDALTRGLLLQLTRRDPTKRLVDFDEIECRLLQIIRR